LSRCQGYALGNMDELSLRFASGLTEYLISLDTVCIPKQQ
jgi:hypothetical protein